jgi:LPS export ABC transporter permease LptG
MESVEVADGDDRADQRLTDRFAPAYVSQCYTPAVRILSRYFLASYLTLFISILLGSIIVVVIVELLLNLDEMVEHRPGLAGIFDYLVLRVPHDYLPIVIPVSSYAAAFLCLGLPARWSEITAVKAGGIAPQRTALPLLTASAVLSLAAFAVNETLVLDARRALNRLDRSGDEITFRLGSFWYHSGGMIFNVREANRENRTLHGVRLFELGPRGRLLRSVRAELVEIKDDRYWRFVDATVRSFDLTDVSAPPQVERTSETTLEVARERHLALLDATANTLSLPDLRDYIEARRQEGRDTARYVALLNTRLAEPLGVFLFALLAIPLGLSVDQNGNIAKAALHGVVILFVFYTVQVIVPIFATRGFSSAGAGPWLAFTAFGGYGVWRLVRIPR